MRHTGFSAGLGLAAVAVAAGLVRGAEPPDVPVALAVAPAHKLALEVHARGVQIYECKAAAGAAAGLAWVFKAPEAELFDASGNRVGRHYAGPTWEGADGSRVVGEVKAKADAPVPDAIPWLLLAAKSGEGNGVFATIQAIQRVHTTGGKAPAACEAADAGKEKRVPYTADYYFYSAG
jgi:hypothetical protein